MCVCVCVCVCVVGNRKGGLVPFSPPLSEERRYVWKGRREANLPKDKAQSQKEDNAEDGEATGDSHTKDHGEFLLLAYVV